MANEEHGIGKAAEQGIQKSQESGPADFAISLEAPARLSELQQGKASGALQGTSLRDQVNMQKRASFDPKGLTIGDSQEKDELTYREAKDVRAVLDVLRSKIYMNNVAKGFYDDAFNFGEKIALIVSELSEALEADRIDASYYTISNRSKSVRTPDKHLPHMPAVAVELADAIIRILDLSSAIGIDIGAAITEKHNFNRSRPYKHGKGY